MEEEDSHVGCWNHDAENDIFIIWIMWHNGDGDGKDLDDIKDDDDVEDDGEDMNG